MEEYVCTVLLVSYNHEKYIRYALESIVSQKTNYKFKVHVFDDASTDGTRDIINEYEKMYPSIVIPFFSERNRGAQQNIWDAYKSVDTKYCAFLEGDDYWCDSEKLQLQIDALEQNPDCSYCAHNTIFQNENDVYRQKEDGNIMVYNRNVRDTGKYSGEDFIPLYGAGWVNHNNSRIIRMECVDLDALTDKEDFLYDNAQFFYLLNRGKVYFIQKVMSVYNMNMASTFTSMQVQNKITSHWSRMLHINETTNHMYEKLIYRHLASFTKYWFSLEDWESGVLTRHSDLVSSILRLYKKIRYDTKINYQLKKSAKKNIEMLKKRMNCGV